MFLSDILGVATGTGKLHLQSRSLCYSVYAFMPALQVSETVLAVMLFREQLP